MDLAAFTKHINITAQHAHERVARTVATHVSRYLINHPTIAPERLKKILIEQQRAYLAEAIALRNNRGYPQYRVMLTLVYPEGTDPTRSLAYACEYGRLAALLLEEREVKHAS